MLAVHPPAACTRCPPSHPAPPHLQHCLEQRAVAAVELALVPAGEVGVVRRYGSLRQRGGSVSQQAQAQPRVLSSESAMTADLLGAP